VTLTPSFPEWVDVAVVGGGVAGAVCAAELARVGVSVALIHGGDRRETSVEALSGRARWRLHRLGLPTIAGTELTETISLWDSDEPITRSTLLDPYGVAIAVERADLDRTLREAAVAAGAHLVCGRAKAVEEAANGWRLHLGYTTIGADQLVIATGTAGGSLVTRQSRWLSRETAWLCRAPGPSAPRLWIEGTDRGWWYALPGRHDTFLGCCAESRRRHRGDLRGAFLEALETTRLIAGLVPDRSALGQVWAAPASVRAYDRVVGGNWIAVGNAAFAADPLCGEGLRFAIETAIEAADVIGGWTPRLSYEDWIETAAQSHLVGRAEAREGLAS
jgi:flavin-dependent dehydrogenase